MIRSSTVAYLSERKHCANGVDLTSQCVLNIQTIFKNTIYVLIAIHESIIYLFKYRKNNVFNAWISFFHNIKLEYALQIYHGPFKHVF